MGTHSTGFINSAVFLFSKDKFASYLILNRQLTEREEDASFNYQHWKLLLFGKSLLFNILILIFLPKPLRGLLVLIPNLTVGAKSPIESVKRVVGTLLNMVSSGH
jgi:hypothetical protein